MLIELDDSLNDTDYLNRNIEKLKLVIDAHINGFHYLFLNKSLRQTLQSIFTKEPKYKNAIERIFIYTTQTGSLREFVKKKVLIVNDISPGFIEKDKIICIKLSKIIPNINATCLLGENMQDAKFYKKLSELYISRKRINYEESLSCTLRAGGGDTTVDSLEQIYNEKNYFCLCVLDKDKKEDGHYGTTASKVINFCKGCEGSFDYFVIPCLEIENLISPKIYKEIAYENNLDSNKIDSLNLLANKEFNFVKFFDFKEGDVPIKGLGKDIFKKFIVWLEKDNGRNEREFFQKLDDDYKELHIEVVSVIISWTCAPEKMIIT